MVSSEALVATDPDVDRWLGVVLDHELGGFGRRPVDQQLDQPQGHVDAAGDAGGGDDPPVEVLDHPFGRPG